MVPSSQIKEHSQSALAGARLAGQSNDGSKKVILNIQSRQHPVRILGSLKHPILHVVNSRSPLCQYQLSEALAMGRGLDNHAVAVNNETISRELKVTNSWTSDYGSSPDHARSITFNRFGVGGHKRAEYDKFCAPSGMIRPGVDALPHHYGLEQNRSLLRANIAQHNQAMSVATVPQQQYDQQRDTSYLCTSPTEITAKSHDFMYKIPNRLFDSGRYLPSRERRARAARRGADTCQLAPVHKRRRVHSLKGTDQLAHTRNAMADELAVVTKELMQMDQPPVTTLGMHELMVVAGLYRVCMTYSVCTCSWYLQGSQMTLGATIGGVFYPGRNASAP